MRVLLSTLVGIVLVTSAPLYATNVDVSPDVRCIVVGARLSTSNDADVKYRAAMLLMYYLGRFDGRALAYDLESLLVTAGKMTPEEFQREAQRCGDALAAKGQEMVKIGAALGRQGQ